MKRKLKVLVACEESQRVCTAFRNLGHEAYSCDIEPCSGGHDEWHIMQDVLPLLDGDCTFYTECRNESHESRYSTYMNDIQALLPVGIQKAIERQIDAF